MAASRRSSSSRVVLAEGDGVSVLSIIQQLPDWHIRQLAQRPTAECCESKARHEREPVGHAYPEHEDALLHAWWAFLTREETDECVVGVAPLREHRLDVANAIHPSSQSHVCSDDNQVAYDCRKDLNRKGFFDVLPIVIQVLGLTCVTENREKQAKRASEDPDGKGLRNDRSCSLKEDEELTLVVIENHLFNWGPGTLCSERSRATPVACPAAT
mmetsp:Transcript_38801/g.69601  ORF Transcript_38801/g.69601 Transcript_38801/m.69601 type:complete len:214 (-) Transcript_38801:53-694(-)